MLCCTLGGFAPGEIVLKSHQFDETTDQPAIQCSAENVVDCTNGFAADSEGVLVDACLPGGGINTVPLSSPQAEIQTAAARKAAESEAGAIGSGQGAIQAGIQTKGANAQTLSGMLDIADPLIDAATGSATGAGYDAIAKFFGGAPTGAKAIAQLQVLQAGLMTNMPRMEGPQSDRDVELYQKAAGQIGDPTVPREIKKAAVKTIREIQGKYSDRAQNTGAAPFKIFMPGSPESNKAKVDEFNQYLDKYAPRK